MRILCLDIGSSSVKAIEILSSFGRSEIVDKYERRVLAGQDPVALAAQVLEKDIPEKPTKVVVMLRANRTVSRRFVFPTLDKKNLKNSVQFELEDDLPFEPDTFQYDLASKRIGKTKQSSVFVSACLDQTLEDYIQKLNQHGLDPDFLIPEALAYRSIFQSTGVDTDDSKPVIPGTEEEPKPIFLLNLGHTHSTLYASYQGVPILCRELQWGGEEIALALAKSYDLNSDSAEKTKIHHGFVLPASQIQQVTEEQLKFSEVVFESLQPLLTELKQADLSCKSTTGHRASKIYLIGGTALLPGLPAVIAEETRTPTQILHSFEGSTPTRINLSEAEQSQFAMALGGALSALPTAKDFRINFRKGKFAKKQGTSQQFEAKVFDGALKVSTFFGLFLWMIFSFQTKVFEKRLEDTDSRLASQIRGFFAGLSSSELRNYLANESALRRGIDNELKTQRDLEKLLEPGLKTPSLFLKTISQQIPKDLIVDVMSYRVGSSAKASFFDQTQTDQDIELVVRVPQPQNLDRLEEIFKKLTTGLKRSESKSVTGKDGVKRFEVVFAGKMKEIAPNGF